MLFQRLSIRCYEEGRGNQASVSIFLHPHSKDAYGLPMDYLW